MSGWRTGAGANGRGVTQGPTGCTAPHEAVTERWLALKMEQEQVRGQGRGQEQEEEQESVAMSEASVATQGFDGAARRQQRYVYTRPREWSNVFL